MLTLLSLLAAGTFAGDNWRETLPQEYVENYDGIVPFLGRGINAGALAHFHFQLGQPDTIQPVSGPQGPLVALGWENATEFPDGRGLFVMTIVTMLDGEVIEIGVPSALLRRKQVTTLSPLMEAGYTHRLLVWHEETSQWFISEDVNQYNKLADFDDLRDSEADVQIPDKTWTDIVVLLIIICLIAACCKSGCCCQQVEAKEPQQIVIMVPGQPSPEGVHQPHQPQAFDPQAIVNPIPSSPARSSVFTQEGRIQPSYLQEGCPV